MARHEFPELALALLLDFGEKALHVSCLTPPNGCGFLRATNSEAAVDRLEIRNIEIVHGYFDLKVFFQEGHQLDGKERVDDPALEEIVVVGQIREVDGGENERPDLGGGFEFLR